MSIISPIKIAFYYSSKVSMNICARKNVIVQIFALDKLCQNKICFNFDTNIQRIFFPLYILSSYECTEDSFYRTVSQAPFHNH